MNRKWKFGLTQPLVAVTVGGLAVLLVMVSMLMGASDLGRVSSSTLLLAVSLVAAVALAYEFPIYIRHHTKLCVFSVPMYLIAVFLPPPLAAIAAGAGILIGELLVRSRRGNRLCDAVTHTGRWTIVVLLGSVVAHIPLGVYSLGALPLMLAACLLLAGDILSLPLVLTPITREDPRHVVRTVIGDGVLVEAVQYMIALAGALAATRHIWVLVLMALPTIFVYLASRKEMDADTVELLESMAEAIDLRDPYTSGHSQRVAELAAGILRELRMHGQEADMIVTAARVHDIGRLGLPDAILLKEGTLSAEEQALMTTYPERGAELLRKYPDFARGIEMVQYHRERWDGSGYPYGLKGTAIPFGARLVAVADSFDAMTSERPYRHALSIDRAVAILLEGRGRQWDPDLVDAFVRSINYRLEAAPETSPAGYPLGVVSHGSEKLATAS